MREGLRRDASALAAEQRNPVGRDWADDIAGQLRHALATAGAEQVARSVAVHVNTQGIPHIQFFPLDLAAARVLTELVRRAAPHRRDGW